MSAVAPNDAVNGGEPESAAGELLLRVEQENYIRVERASQKPWCAQSPTLGSPKAFGERPAVSLRELHDHANIEKPSQTTTSRRTSY